MATYSAIRTMEATPLQIAGAKQAGLTVPGETMTKRERSAHVDREIQKYMQRHKISDYSEGMKRLFAEDRALHRFYVESF